WSSGPEVMVGLVGGRVRHWVEATNQALQLHDRVWLGLADPLHYGKAFRTDRKGAVTFPALIAGATYRIALPGGKVKDFRVESGKALDLGDLTVVERAPPVKVNIEAILPLYADDVPAFLDALVKEKREKNDRARGKGPVRNPKVIKPVTKGPKK